MQGIHPHCRLYMVRVPHSTMPRLEPSCTFQRVRLSDILTRVELLSNRPGAFHQAFNAYEVRSLPDLINFYHQTCGNIPSIWFLIFYSCYIHLIVHLFLVVRMTTQRWYDYDGATEVQTDCVSSQYFSTITTKSKINNTKYTTNSCCCSCWCCCHDRCYCRYYCRCHFRCCCACPHLRRRNRRRKTIIRSYPASSYNTKCQKTIPKLVHSLTCWCYWYIYNRIPKAPYHNIAWLVRFSSSSTYFPPLVLLLFFFYSVSRVKSSLICCPVAFLYTWWSGLCCRCSLICCRVAFLYTWWFIYFMLPRCSWWFIFCCPVAFVYTWANFINYNRYRNGWVVVVVVIIKPEGTVLSVITSLIKNIGYGKIAIIY